MPKKIKDAESKIMDAAEIVFREKGYIKADMKEIAKYAGVAVGTLYNYWPSKKLLFGDVSKEYWKGVFEKTDEIMKSGVNPRLKSMLFTKNMYNHFEEQINMHKSGTGIELFSFFMSLNGVWDEIQSRMENILDEIIKSESTKMDRNDFERMARMMPLSMISCIVDFPEDKENNIRFINNFMNCAMIHQGGENFALLVDWG